MSKTSYLKKYSILTGVLFLFPISLLLFLGPGAKHNFKIPSYYGPKSLSGKDTVYYTLPGITLHDQEGRGVSLTDLHGKFWLAAFFSVSDTNLVKITKRLLYFSDRYIDQPDIGIVCFDTEPGKNSNEALRDFISHMPTYDGTLQNIRFLTGSPEEMDSLYRAFQIVDISKEQIFRLVDSEGHIRGLYGNTEYHMADAIDDIGMIKKEYDLRKFYERKNRNQ